MAQGNERIKTLSTEIVTLKAALDSKDKEIISLKERSEPSCHVKI